MQIVNKDFVRSISVSVSPTASATALTWVFPDLPQLRNRKFLAIEANVCAGDTSTSKVNLFADYTTFLNSTTPGFLTLYDRAGLQFVQNIPLYELLNSEYDNYAFPVGTPRNTNGLYWFKEREVVWPKCTVYFPTATGIANACLLFNVYYK